MTFNVLLIGAGEINFGSVEGPWNHTARLELLLGDKLKVIGLIDPDHQRAKDAITAKRNVDGLKNIQNAWKDTLIFSNVKEAKSSLNNMEISLIIIGCPPHFRGTLERGKNTDVEILQSFPNAKSILVEKPVAAVDPQIFDLESVNEIYQNYSGICSIGYMLRYLKVVKKIKDILHQNNLKPTIINGRYFMAYEFARKLAWWNSAISCGPVVEQATHFVDLIRYFADSPIVWNSVHAHTVEHDESVGELSKLFIDEKGLIEPQDRIPRITMASWKHSSGTIGSISHGISLHGTRYDTQLEVLADGWLFRISGAYTDAPQLDIIQPGTSEIQTFKELDDPFMTEIKTIVESNEKPLSTFEDALETYKLTWSIRRAGEKSRIKNE